MLCYRLQINPSGRNCEKCLSTWLVKSEDNPRRSPIKLIATQEGKRIIRLFLKIIYCSLFVKSHFMLIDSFFPHFCYLRANVLDNFCVKKSFNYLESYHNQLR